MSLFFVSLKVHASRQDIIREERLDMEIERTFSLEQLITNDHHTTIEMKHDQANKLDCLMFIMFEYIKNTGVENGNENMKIKKIFQKYHFCLYRNSEL